MFDLFIFVNGSERFVIFRDDILSTLYFVPGLCVKLDPIGFVNLENKRARASESAVGKQKARAVCVMYVPCSPCACACKKEIAYRFYCGLEETRVTDYPK